MESKIGNYKTVCGYVIYDRNDNSYYDEDDCYRNIDEVSIYDDFNVARDIIEELDENDGIEIHKIKVSFDVEAIYQRNVVYDIVAGKIEE